MGEDYELVLINDGSRDGSWPLMQKLAEGDPRLFAINLSRNHGHQLALTAGLDLCRGDAILIIDADLQDPPELLSGMLETMREAQADVVYGVRRSRAGETAFKRATAHGFYRLLSRATEVDIPLDAGDFRLMSRRALDALLAMPEQARFIRGMVAWIGFRQVPFAYDRQERFAGETKYPLSKMMRFAFDALTGFSSAPLKLASHGADAAGNRRDGGSDLSGFFVSDVANETALAVIGRNAVDADVDDRRARLDPVAANHLGPADGGDDDISTPDDVRQIPGARVRDGHRCTFPDQELRHWFADDVRPADHDGVEAAEAAELLLQQMEAAERRARHEGREARRQPSCIDGVKPVDILRGIDRLDDAGCVDLRRKRKLDEDAVDPIVSIEIGDQLQKFALADRVGQIARDADHAGFRGRAVLGSDVDRACRVFADQHRREAGRSAGGALEAGGKSADPITDRLGCRFPVDPLRRHQTP